MQGYFVYPFYIRMLHINITREFPDCLFESQDLYTESQVN
jgi:hypothetical protein